jgi:hypothetical protein
MRHSSILTSLLTSVGALLLATGCLVTTSSGRRPPPPEPRHHEGRPPPPAGPAERSLEGVITDASTGKPLARASIDIVDPSGKSQTVQVGPDGHYRFGSLPPGKFAIRCRLDGYEKFEQGYSITDGPARLDCPLQPKRR